MIKMQTTYRTREGARRSFCSFSFCFLLLDVLCTVLCLAALLVLSAGCDGHKKAALTEEEVKRLTLAQKPDRPDQLIVSGEIIRCEDAMDSSAEDSANAVPLKERLASVARQTTWEQFREVARPPIQQRLANRIMSVVLSKRARKDLGEKIDENLDKMAERELRRFIVDEYGGNGAQADEALQRRGMSRSSYKEWKKKQILAQYIFDSKYPRKQPVTYGEMLARYDAMKDENFRQPGVVQFRLIDIPAAGIEAGDPNEDPARRARALGEELRQKVDAGADFGELAGQYSQGQWKEQGGLWRPRDPDSLAAPYDVLAREAQNMKPGEVAGPIEAPGRVFLMKLEQKQEPGYRPLSEVQEEVRENILAERRRKVVDEIDEEITRQVALADTDRFIDYCLERLYRQVHESPSAPVAPVPYGPVPPPSQAPGSDVSPRGE